MCGDCPGTTRTRVSVGNTLHLQRSCLPAGCLAVASAPHGVAAVQAAEWVPLAAGKARRTAKSVHTGPAGWELTRSVATAYDCTCGFRRHLPLRFPCRGDPSQLMALPMSLTSSFRRDVNADIQWYTPCSASQHSGLCVTGAEARQSTHPQLPLGELSSYTNGIHTWHELVCVTKQGWNPHVRLDTR